MTGDETGDPDRTPEEGTMESPAPGPGGSSTGSEAQSGGGPVGRDVRGERRVELTEEDRKRIAEVDWWHHIRIGDVVTPGRGDHDVVKYMERSLPATFEGRTVLDIGCWDGYFSFLAEDRGASRVVGIDKELSDGIKLARELLGSGIEAHGINMFDFETEERFDVVLFLGVYYHVHTIVEAFERVYRWTREGGEAYIEGDLFLGRLNRFVNLPQWMKLIKDPKLPPNLYFWLPTLSSLKALVRFVGFKEVEVLGFLYSRVIIRARK